MTDEAPRRSLIPSFLRNPFFLAFLVGAGLLTLSVPFFRHVPPSPAPIGTMPPWTFEDASGQAFGSAELAGRTYIVVLVGHACTSTCARVGRDLGTLETQLRAMRADVPIVTVGVDDATAEQRRAFVTASGGDPAGWHAVGGSAEAACALAQGSFARVRAIVVPCDRVPALAHDPQALIVDGEGRIRASIRVDTGGLEELLHRSLAVLENRPFEVPTGG